MKRMFIAGLILLISGTLTATAAATDNIIFSENWESGRIDFGNWSIGGIPYPQIVEPGRNRSRYALDSNGDRTCDSAVSTVQQFFTANGLRAEFWLKIDTDCRLCYTTTSRTGFTTRDKINSGGCRAGENYYQGLAYVELNGQTGRINYVVQPFGTIFSEFYDVNQWYQYTVQINATGIVDFYRDGKLKASSTVPLDLKSYLDTRFQHSGQKNIAPHLIDDITISIPETGDLALFDSEVDNYTLVSIDPPISLPTEPLKGLVRITAKVLPFVDFDSDSALVVSLTSLSENLGLGPGSIQVAVPETVNPVYDSIQTEWTYDKLNCGGPFTLGIPQIDCDDPDVLANLLLQLYPPIGSAVISSLGLQSSVQCAGNNPYAGTLFEAYNTHDTLNYLWYDPAASACAGGEPYDGKEIEIFIPISGEIGQVLEDLGESLMALNVRFQVIVKTAGEVFEVDILTDPIGP